MSVLELECKPSIMAASYLLSLYGAAFLVMTFSDYYWQVKVMVACLLIVVGMRECWRVFFYRKRPMGIRFSANQWALMINEKWCLQTDLTLYYDWYFCLALRYRDSQDKKRIYLIWRETIPLNEWKKLRSYLYIYLK